MRKLSMVAVLAVCGVGLVPAELDLLITPAHAIVGRPLTPVSVAGVARRTTRRAVVYGAAVKPTTVVVAAPVTTTCVTKYDAYGTKTTVCS